MLYVAGLCAIVAVAVGAAALRSFQAEAALKMKAGPLGQARPGGLVHLMGRVAPQEELLASP